MKMFKISCLAIGLLLPLIFISQTHAGYTEASNPAELKRMIKEVSSQTQSISSDFIQEKNLTMMEEIIISKGRFLFRKENNVKWEYTEPINYAIFINDNRFIINNDGKISEYDTESNKLFREINNMIVMAIQGNFVDDPEFTASFLENNISYLAVLKPQNDLLKDILQTIEISFDKNEMAVLNVRFVEPGDDYTLITFTNRKANIQLSDDSFDVN